MCSARECGCAERRLARTIGTRTTQSVASPARFTELLRASCVDTVARTSTHHSLGSEADQAHWPAIRQTVVHLFFRKSIHSYMHRDSQINAFHSSALWPPAHALNVVTNAPRVSATLYLISARGTARLSSIGSTARHPLISESELVGPVILIWFSFRLDIPSFISVHMSCDAIAIFTCCKNKSLVPRCFDSVSQPTGKQVHE